MIVTFKERYGPRAIVAGASKGVGRSFARQIAAQGVSCILIANGGPVEEVAAEIRTEIGVEYVNTTIDLSALGALDHRYKAFLLNFCESVWSESRADNVDVFTIVLDRTDTPNSGDP